MSLPIAATNTWGKLIRLVVYLVFSLLFNNFAWALIVLKLFIAVTCCFFSVG